MEQPESHQATPGNDNEAKSRTDLKCFRFGESSPLGNCWDDKPCDF